MGSLWTINDNSCKERNTEMKKIYQNPEINVIKIKPILMNAASPVYGGSTDATSGNLAKDSWNWSDDEPEEEYTKW